mgnify:CR=1 FL=1
MLDYARFTLLIGSVLRWGLSVLAGYLVSTGALTSDKAAEFTAAAITLVLPLAWSLYQKAKDRKKFEVALALPRGATEADVKAAIASPKL